MSADLLQAATHRFVPVRDAFLSKWSFHAQACDGQVWFYVDCGGMSGGLFLPRAEVEQLQAVLAAAISDAIALDQPATQAEQEAA